MNTEKVNVVEKIHTTVQERVESLGEGLKVAGDVTTQNGVVTAIDSIMVSDPENGMQLWCGCANPAISGSYCKEGREIDVLMAIIEFVTAVKTNN